MATSHSEHLLASLAGQLHAASKSRWGPAMEEYGSTGRTACPPRKRKTSP
jgi:hypothetical protein